MLFFSSKCSKWDFQDFENVWKQHEIHKSSLLSSLKNKQQRQKHHTYNVLILSLLLVIIMVKLLKVFKVGLSPSKTLLYLLQWKPFEIYLNAFYFKLKTLLVLKIFKFLCWLFSHVKKRLDKKDKFNFKIYSNHHSMVNKQLHYIYWSMSHKVKATRQLNLVRY